ncbi:unnamed protein product [Linum tenue]|uniref:Uncharacterized protein n=1 Tax=Linum tenue TaxID=586396 RepID=A0AAV0I2B5_9ROSI|nr:unnamed protein product [Linum tenue]
MGNCMVVEEKVVKVMRPDGKILEYTSPTIVQQVMSDFPGQFVCDHSYSSLQQQQQQQNLLPEAKLVGGRLYYLVPLPPPVPASPEKLVVKQKKKVRFAVPEGGEKESSQNKKVEEHHHDESDVKGGGVVRIKLVITKQELEELLKKGGVSVGDMVSHLQDQQRLVKVDVGENDQQQQEEEEWQKNWKPVLESIPEIA